MRFRADPNDQAGAWNIVRVAKAKVLGLVRQRIEAQEATNTALEKGDVELILAALLSCTIASVSPALGHRSSSIRTTVAASRTHLTAVTRRRRFMARTPHVRPCPSRPPRWSLRPHPGGNARAPVVLSILPGAAGHPGRLWVHDDADEPVDPEHSFQPVVLRGRGVVESG